MDDEGSYPSAQRLNNGSVPHANATAPAMSVLIENNENGTSHENKNVRKFSQSGHKPSHHRLGMGDKRPQPISKYFSEFFLQAV